MWAELTSGRVDLLLAAVVTTMLTYALRALRWQYLLAGLGPTRFSVAFRATVIGFAASFLLPARAGEFLRPYVLAKNERLSVPAAFATVVLERVFDMATVLVLFAVFLFTADPALARVGPGDVPGRAGRAASRRRRRRWSILGVFYFLAGHPEAIGRWSAKVERRLPGAARGAGRRAGPDVRRRAARRPAAAAAAAGVRVVVPAVALASRVGIWLVSRAFRIDLPFVGAFLVMTLLVVGVAVPTPGAIGGFHMFYQIGVMSFYHASKDKAVGAALVLHAVSFVPVTLLGIVFMVQEGLTLGRMRTLASERGAAGEDVR